MSNARQTLVEIYHPAFRDGYQDGRQKYFQGPSIFTDKEFVECLQFVFEQGEQEDAKEREECLYYSVGQLVGRMSGCMIPCLPHEDRTRELQEAFLTKIVQKYGEAGNTITDAIRQFWFTQDHLAQLLDADTFEVMIHRGLERK